MSNERDDDDLIGEGALEETKLSRARWQPLFINGIEMSRRLGIAKGEWPRVRRYFEGKGMPKKDPIVGKWFWPAMVFWLYQYYGILKHDSGPPDGKENWGPPPPRTYQKRRRIKE